MSTRTHVEAEGLPELAWQPLVTAALAYGATDRRLRRLVARRGRNTALTEIAAPGGHNTGARLR